MNQTRKFNFRTYEHFSGILHSSPLLYVFLYTFYLLPRVWNLVFDIKRGTQNEGISEQGAEENI
jgi:hypothetical protein